MSMINKWSVKRDSMSLFYFEGVWYKFNLIYVEISHIVIYDSKIENESSVVV